MGHDVSAQMHVAWLRQPKLRRCGANAARDLGHGFRSIVKGPDGLEKAAVIARSDLDHASSMRSSASRLCGESVPKDG
jgi:hypothetical protein